MGFQPFQWRKVRGNRNWLGVCWKYQVWFKLLKLLLSVLVGKSELWQQVDPHFKNGSDVVEFSFLLTETLSRCFWVVVGCHPGSVIRTQAPSVYGFTIIVTFSIQPAAPLATRVSQKVEHIISAYIPLIRIESQGHTWLMGSWEI